MAHGTGAAVGPSSRVVQVPARRMSAWLAGFAARHGPAQVGLPADLDAESGRRQLAEAASGLAGAQGGASALVVARDGAAALVVPPAWLADRPEVRAWVEAALLAPGSGDPVEQLGLALAAAVLHAPYGVVLLRRAGYAVAVLAGGEVVASKVGSRYVQGRTAAGGWSQQRYARRRANQADALVDSTVAVAARILAGPPAIELLVTGGDRPLVEAAVRALPPALAAVPRGPHLAVGNPDRKLLDTIGDLATAVTVRVTDPVDPAP